VLAVVRPPWGPTRRSSAASLAVSQVKKAGRPEARPSSIRCQASSSGEGESEVAGGGSSCEIVKRHRHGRPWAPGLSPPAAVRPRQGALECQGPGDSRSRPQVMKWSRVPVPHANLHVAEDCALHGTRPRSVDSVTAPGGRKSHGSERRSSKTSVHVVAWSGLIQDVRWAQYCRQFGEEMVRSRWVRQPPRAWVSTGHIHGRTRRVGALLSYSWLPHAWSSGRRLFSKQRARLALYRAFHVLPVGLSQMVDDVRDVD